MAARAAQRYDHDEFVTRFLEGLSNSLSASNGPRLSGVKRSLDATRNNNAISTSMKVLNARMALGADDQAYLSTGLSLLWAGDPNPETGDDPHLLFPSSMGGAGLPQGARQAMEATIRVRLEEQINQRLASLTARLPALLHILSLPEVGWHVKEELEAVRLWSSNPTSMASLITAMAALPAATVASQPNVVPSSRYAPRTRHSATFGDDAWRARIESVRENPAYVEELLTVCSVLSGLYGRSSTDPEVLSPMEVADLYTSAAVDVALERDWSTMEGVMRSYRAYRASQEAQPVPPAAAGGAARGAPPNTAPDTSEVLRARRVVPRAANVPVLDAGRVPQPLPARAAPVGAGAAHDGTAADQVQVPGQHAGEDDEAAPLAVAMPPRAARGWMGGLLDDVPQPADVGAHSGDPAGTVNRHEDDNYPEHRIERTMQQLNDVGPTTYADGVGRVASLVLEPIGTMAGMSMSLSASPLWNPRILDNDFEPGLVHQTLNPDDRDGVLGPAPVLTRAAGAALAPSASERWGTWIPGDEVLPQPPQQRMSNHTVVRALFTENMGVTRVIPAEVTDWLSSNVGGLRPSNANDLSLDDGFALPGDEARRDRLRANILDVNSRGARVDDVMAPPLQYMDGNGRDNRFVSYALLRGLTADHGPNEVGPAAASTLRYTRGITLDVARYARPAPMAPLPDDGADRVPLVPPELLARWQERDTPPLAIGAVNNATRVFTSELVEMIKHNGPAQARAVAPAYVRGRPRQAEYEYELTVRLTPEIALANNNRQDIQNTLRYVRWAPIQRAPGVAGTAMKVPSYTLGARAASATATYEHLIDTLSPAVQAAGAVRTPVPANLRGALRAALKLKQLPHCIAFDAAYRAAGGNMQQAMAADNARMVAIWDAAGATASYRTLLPTRREHSQNVYEVVPPAFTGVWDNQPGFEEWRAPGVTTTQRIAERQFDLGTGAPLPFRTEDALAQLRGVTRAAGVATIETPDDRLEVAHLPIGLPFSTAAIGAPAPDVPVTLGPRQNQVQAHNLINSTSPEWLDSDAAVRTLIDECGRLAARIIDLRAQYTALSDARNDDAADGLQSVVERERRGAIWEDALREMSISSDRLYNFLRSMSGTLHEDIQAVVEDHAMEAANRAIRERRQEVLKASSQFQSRLIESVMQGVLRDSKLQFDLQADPAAQGRQAATELVVVNKETVDRVRDLAQGTSGMPFFTQNVQLERTLGSSSEPMRLVDLMERLQRLAMQVREGMLDAINQSSMDGTRSSLEYLSRPRNSYLVRLKPEAFAAIKGAYSTFSTEWRNRFQMSMRRPSAWECIEGTDMNLTNAFAEFCAHKMAHSRMFGSSHAGYIGATPARANAIQLRMALQKLVSRAHEYVQLVPPPVYSAGAAAYNAQMPQDFLVDNVLATGNQAYTAMVGNSLFQRGRRWGWNMTGSA